MEVFIQVLRCPDVHYRSYVNHFSTPRLSLNFLCCGVHPHPLHRSVVAPPQHTTSCTHRERERHTHKHTNSFCASRPLFSPSFSPSLHTPLLHFPLPPTLSRPGVTLWPMAILMLLLTLKLILTLIATSTRFCAVTSRLSLELSSPRSSWQPARKSTHTLQRT